MSKILVKNNRLEWGGKAYVCAIGKGGFSKDKKEGDGATPIGTFALRECWYRADRLAMPQTELPLHIIHENDGWCDDPKSTDYNKHILIPPPVGGRLGGGHTCSAEQIMPPPQPSPYGGGSYERLWRDEHVYDLIVPLGYNDESPVPGKGSAIFLHLAKPGYPGTEGCVALALADLLDVLKLCGSGTVIDIQDK